MNTVLTFAILACHQGQNGLLLVWQFYFYLVAEKSRINEGLGWRNQRI